MIGKIIILLLIVGVALLFCHAWGAFTPWYNIQGIVEQKIIINGYERCIVSGSLPDGTKIRGYNNDAVPYCLYKVGDTITINTNGYWINVNNIRK